LLHVHFNLASAGVGSLPGEIAPNLCALIRGEFTARNMTMTSVSGTFNAIDPDRARRERNIGRACRLIECSPQFRAPAGTLGTGTRDAGEMWRRHPGNDLPDAWRDLLATLDQLLPVAEGAGILLGVEPEPNNVVNSAAKARRLLDELQSPYLKIVMDAANLCEG